MPAIAGGSPAPSLLVVGDNNVGKYTLVSSLQPENSTKSNDLGYHLHLDTKYYTAAVGVEVASTSQSVNVRDHEAVLLMFDATREASFNQLKAWEQSNNTEDTEVKLVVANKVDLLTDPVSQQRDTWLEAAKDWCCEHCYEYIEACAANPSIDRQLTYDEEQQGIARIEAALQAHMWPGLHEKPRHAGRTLPANSSGDSLASDQTSRDQGSTDESSGRQDSQAAPSCSVSDQPEACNITQQGHDGDLESDMHQFERLMTELAGMLHAL